MGFSIQARVVGIDACVVFVATEDHVGSFQRDALPPEWWRHLKSAAVNGRVAGLVDRDGVPAATPFEVVPLLSWPDKAPNT